MLETKHPLPNSTTQELVKHNWLSIFAWRYIFEQDREIWLINCLNRGCASLTAGQWKLSLSLATQCLQDLRKSNVYALQSWRKTFLLFGLLTILTTTHHHCYPRTFFMALPYLLCSFWHQKIYEFQEEYSWLSLKDHNTSSLRSKDFFHGTAVSFMQFLTPENLRVPRGILPIIPKANSNVTPMPTEYTDITEVSLVRELCTRNSWWCEDTVWCPSDFKDKGKRVFVKCWGFEGQRKSWAQKNTYQGLHFMPASNKWNELSAVWLCCHFSQRKHSQRLWSLSWISSGKQCSASTNTCDYSRHASVCYLQTDAVAVTTATRRTKGMLPCSRGYTLRWTSWSCLETGWTGVDGKRLLFRLVSLQVKGLMPYQMVYRSQEQDMPINWQQQSYTFSSGQLSMTTYSFKTKQKRHRHSCHGIRKCFQKSRSLPSGLWHCIWRFSIFSLCVLWGQLFQTIYAVSWWICTMDVRTQPFKLCPLASSSHSRRAAANQSSFHICRVQKGTLCCAENWARLFRRGHGPSPWTTQWADEGRWWHCRTDWQFNTFAQVDHSRPRGVTDLAQVWKHLQIHKWKT